MTPVVFVHGFMGGSAQWAGQLDAFGGAPVVALDLPGFGDNAHLDALATIEDYAEWSLEDLSARGVSDFHLIGHSMGGMVAQEMAARAPNRIQRLVLYGTGAQGVLPGRFESIETSKERAKKDGAQATARRIAATWFLDQEQATAYDACAAIAERSSIAAIMTGLEAMNLWDGRAKVPDLGHDTLIVWGDGDRTYPWSQTEFLWTSIARSHLAVIPNSAHAPHMERPGLFNALVGEFVTGSVMNATV